MIIRPSQYAESGGVNVGGNAGNITIGYTYEEHQAALREREVQIRVDLERAHTAEKALLQHELDEIRRQLADLQSSYEARCSELEEAGRALLQLGEKLPAGRMKAAFDALGKGDTREADALFAEVEGMEAEAIARAATAAWERGRLAESDVRWADAAQHYANAARLSPSLERLQRAGVFAARMGDYTNALKFGTDMIALAKREHGEGSLRYATALNEHGLTLRANGDLQSSVKHYRESLSTLRRYLPDSASEFVKVLNNLGTSLVYMGRYGEAEKYLKESSSAGEILVGDSHPEHADRLNNLALLYYYTDRYEYAENLFRDALAIRRASLGAKHPLSAQTLCNLAGVLHAIGEFDEAEKYHLEALEIRASVLGNDHPDYAHSLANLGLLYSDTGRLKEAKEMLRAALKIAENVFGREHPDYATSLYNLAGILEKEGRPEEAEPCLRRAYSTRLDLLGRAHPETVQAAERLASNLLDQAKLPDAEPLYRDALAIRKQIGRTNDEGYGISHNNLAGILSETGRPREAERHYLVAADVSKKIHGLCSSEHVHVIVRIADILYITDRKSEARKLLGKTFASLVETLGTSHPLTLEVAGYAVGASVDSAVDGVPENTATRPPTPKRRKPRRRKRG